MSSHARAVKRLGRYEIVKHLAHGGMAEVLLARTVGIEGFERHVVLKRIRADAACDQSYVTMFLDEARIAASLHHHNIVPVTDIGRDNGEYFFTMEYVHGEDARALLAAISRRDELVPLEHVLSIACAAAAGLHHAHEKRGPDRAPLGLIHRDVSPANILIGYDGSVRLADFGIAKLGVGHGARRRAETQAGTLKGKVAYMSPEQCVGEAMDRRSDVFSLGIVLYELCTVRRLFKGDNDFMTMTSIVLGYIPPPSNYRPDLPPELEAVILKALAAKPEDRYQTAEELRFALEKVANQLGLSLLPTSLADFMKRTFGERLEPWLVDAIPEDLDVDFDGSRSGVVSAPIESTASPGITAKIIARGSQPLPRIELEPVEAVPDREISERTTTVIPIPQPRWRTALGIAAAVASVAAFAVALWLSRAPEEAPIPAALLVPPVIEPPAPPPRPAPQLAEPVPIVLPAPVPRPKVWKKPRPIAKRVK